jgi:large subunit ribosomal protein L29
MAKTQIQDIKDLTQQELQEKVHESQVKYKKARFNHAVSPLDNPMSLREMRRDVARLKTELTAKSKAEKSK